MTDPDPTAFPKVSVISIQKKDQASLTARTCPDLAIRVAKKEFHKLVNDVDLARSEIVVVVNQKRSRATVEPLTEADVRDQMAIPPREAVVIEVDPHLQDPDEFSATLVMHIAQRISSPS